VLDESALLANLPAAYTCPGTTQIMEEKLMTNWEAIRELREDYNLSVPDETGPGRLLEILTDAGLSGTETEGLVVLTQTPTTEKAIAFVSASELFAWDEKQDARIASRRVSRLRGTTDLFAAKVALWQKANKSLMGPNAYLYIVDLDGWLDIPEHEDVARLLEQDVRGVRKFVCRPADLAAAFANPFGATSTGSRLPEFEAQRMDPHSFEPPVRDFAATVTHPFVRVADPQCWLAHLNRHPDAPRLTVLANVLARRIMGKDYQFEDGSEDVILDRFGRRTSMSWFMLGIGEQYGLAFCAYLALASEQASQDTWLGITEVVNYLDLSHYLLALDVLRDFVVATGTNVYIKTNKEDYRRLAQGKLEAAVAFLKAQSQ
jgi:hypothetical protein